MFDDARLRKLQRLIPFLVPLVYAATMSYSLSDEWFWSDDSTELAFVRYAPSFRVLQKN